LVFRALMYPPGRAWDCGGSTRQCDVGSDASSARSSCLNQLSTEHMAELKLLGGVVLTDSRGGSGTLTARRHPVALLALLATAPARTLSRAKLIGLLWPEVPERTARNRLTSCVYDVRAALGADVPSG